VSPAPPALDGAYAAVEAPDLWHVAALACFAASLASRPLARMLPAAFRFGLFLPTLTVLLTVIFSLAGCLLAWAGTRRPQIRGASRLALLLNGVVLGLALLAGAAGIWILRR